MKWILFGVFALVSLHAQTPAAREADIDADDDPATDADGGLDNPEARWHYFYDQRVFPNQRFPEGARLGAFRQLKGLENAIRAGRLSIRSADTQGQWKLIGPQPINYSTGFVTSGRVTGIALDPRGKDTAYIGTADGGVWKTTDGGAHWTPLTDLQASLAIGAVALDPSNPDIVYAGTGEENFNADAYTGVGILQSQDGGATWVNFLGPFSRQRIGALAVHPANGQVLLAGSTTGIYRSSDGGMTWMQVLTGTGTSVFFDANQPDVAWAALGNITGAASNGVYRSTDAGVNWARVSGTGATLLPSGTAAGRIEIVPVNGSPDTVYAAVANRVIAGASLNGVYRTNDAGAHWTRLAAPDFCNPQCWFDLVIRPNPMQPDVIFAGGVNLYRSLNGGTTWTSVPGNGASGGPHVDHHALVFSDDGLRLYDGNDGGAWSTDTFTQGSIAWNNLNDTLALTQYYPNLSIHPTEPNVALAGSQDNGTHQYQGRLGWARVSGGDGGNALIDPVSPSTAYASFASGSLVGFSFPLLRTSQFNFNADGILTVHGIDQNDRGRFISQFVADPSNTQTLYYGTYRLYKSVDSGGLWRPISGDLTKAPSTNTTNSAFAISAIAVAPMNSKVLYVGAASAAVYASEDGGQTWSERSAGLPGRAVTHLTVDPLDPATVYVTFSGFAPADGSEGHLYRSRDNGRTWADISGNLPNIPANDAVVDPDNPDTLYLGTDLGALVSGDNGATWQTLGGGLPKTAVVSLVLHRPSRTLRAATHGRSMWDFALGKGSGAGPSITSLTPATKNRGEAAFTLAIRGANLGAGMHVLWNGAERRVTQADDTGLQVEIPASDLAAVGRVTVVVFNPARGGGVSTPAKFVIGPAPLVASGGVVSAATSKVANAAPGSLVSIYGANFAPGVAQATGFPLPVTLGGVTAVIGGFAAPIYFVAPGQLNVQIPYELGARTYALTVDQAGSASMAVSVNVARVAPSLFSLTQTGLGQGAIRVAGSATIAAPEGSPYPGSRPARPGEIVEIYGTGLGAVSPSGVTGATASRLSSTTLTPTVTIGGTAATVLFSGLNPGAAGLYQINVRIPDGVAGDDLPVILSIGGETSNTVTVAVQ